MIAKEGGVGGSHKEGSFKSHVDFVTAILDDFWEFAAGLSIA